MGNIPLRPSDVFLAMLGGAKMRRRAWPVDAYWTIDLEDDDHCPIIVGPERWVRHCRRAPGWVARQWRARDWEVLE